MLQNRPIILCFIHHINLLCKSFEIIIAIRVFTACLTSALGLNDYVQKVVYEKIYLKPSISDLLIIQLYGPFVTHNLAIDDSLEGATPLIHLRGADHTLGGYISGC